MPDKPECAKCAALPFVGVHGPNTGPYRPKPPRPVVYGKTKPSRRCATHRREDLAAAKVRRAEAHVQRTKGLTPAEYDALYEYQGRKCALPRCRATGKARRLAVDHDRERAVNVCGHDRDIACVGCARGLVCGPHNYELLGRFAGDLQDALDYIMDPPWRRLRRGAA